MDVGTTSVKALLVAPDGTEVALGRAPTTWTTTRSGAETSPASITEAARSALADALDQVVGDRVVALGVASMAESGVLVGPDDSALAPIIAWHDHRDEAQLADLVDTFGAEWFSVRTGLPVWTQWSLTKHRWLVDNVPAVRNAVRRYNIAEWVARDLGAAPVTELSLASRTGWLDLASRETWAETMDWSGAPAALLGDLVSAGTPIGKVQASGRLAALDGATVTVAGHDHQAAVVGVGSSGAGDEFDSCGTAEAILRTVNPGLNAEALLALTGAGVTVGWHVIRDRWCLLGATQGGLILGRVRDSLGVDAKGLAELDAAALAAPDDPAVLQISETADVTVSPGAEPGRVWRAATRAVTQQARDLGDHLDRAGGPRRDLVVAGGWTNSAAVMAAKTEAFGPLRRATTTEAGARGAAFLAGLAHGTYPAYDDIPNGARPEDRA
ncbi:MAG TPA: FGGY family carbohydrate kinase [Lapillicoccus sp.]|nr:FGGY family carbohydrate kinase [Lapillicoccus sp.]